VSSTLVSRARVSRGDWDRFVESKAGGWVWHTSDWVDYLVASGREDRSAALIVDGQIGGVHVWCGPVPADDPLPAPLWPDDYAGHRAGPYRSEPRPRHESFGARGFWTRILDLYRSHTELWREMRRSYHQLIHRAKEQYRVGWAAPSTLAALYATQPQLPSLTDGQWACVERIAQAGRFGVLAAWDRTGAVTGAIGVYFWKGRAYYGHGRSRDKNVNHLLHWHAMRWLPQRGVRWYEIGWEARPDDDEKARAIAFHKAGFGGERWWVTVAD